MIVRRKPIYNIKCVQGSAAAAAAGGFAGRRDVTDRHLPAGPGARSHGRRRLPYPEGSVLEGAEGGRAHHALQVRPPRTFHPPYLTHLFFPPYDF